MGLGVHGGDTVYAEQLVSLIFSSVELLITYLNMLNWEL